MADTRLADGSFTVDWVTHNLRVWEPLLAAWKTQAINILEIGSFEGRSAVFFLEYLPKCTLTCIDTFEGGEEHRVSGRPFGTMSEVEARFDQNTGPFGGRVTKLKGHSHDELSKLLKTSQRFQLAYIDGDHHAASALLDARLAWKLLSPGGIMILDDYGWRPELPDSSRPRLGIDEFLSSVRGEFSELSRGYQVVIQKLPELLSPEKVTAEPELFVAGRPLIEIALGNVKPPLVSFVVICWNYAAYVGEAIRSIQEQDYSRFECLVVDNGSEDGSSEVIQKAIAGDHRFRMVRLDRNMGQLGAAIWSLDKVRGQFVVFVDADDVLFAPFTSTHLQVHLSLPRSVSFTSSSVAEVNGTKDALTSHYAHIDLSREHVMGGLRPASSVVRLSTISDERYSLVSSRTGTIPRGIPGWHWGPGTANMYRKSILDLVKLGDGDTVYMRAADNHFNHTCHALTGSAVIDLPLSAYRIHGSNYFSRTENLDGLRKGNPELAKKSQVDRLLSAEVLLENAEKFAWLLGKDYWRVVDNCAGVARGGRSQVYRGASAREVFARNLKQIRAAHGDAKLSVEIMRRFGYRQATKIVGSGLGGKVPIKLRGQMLLYGALQKLRKPSLGRRYRGKRK